MASTEAREASTGSERLCEMVRLTMELRFNGRAYPPEERLEKLQAVQRLTRRTARELLGDDDDDDGEAGTTHKLKDSVDDLLAVDVTPPRAFFLFRGSGRMHLPLIDWSAFRGYSMALWIRVDPSAKASFELFRFTNASATLGVDATLEWQDKNGALLTVRSCAPTSNDQKRNHFGAAMVAAIAPAVTNAPSSDWRQVTHRIQLDRSRWHLLVISHSLHYVKKSRVSCSVDGRPQFSEELVYPSGLVQATKASLGGGSDAEVRVASATMYQEELPASAVEAIFLQGPSVSLFRRWMSVPSGAATEHIVDIRESTVLSPFGTPMENAVSRAAALNKLQVVFSFNARDDIQGHEDVLADRSVEWVNEGLAGSKGKWVSLENVNATSEVLQRNARLGKSVSRTVRQSDDLKSAWNRLFGVEAIPILLDYLLVSVEEVSRLDPFVDNSEKTLFLQETAEKLMTDMLCILRGLLLNHTSNVHQALRTYLLHQFYHSIRRHTDVISSAWTPTNVVACVDTVKSTLRLMPWSLQDARDLNHPVQPSVWSWNPIFASAVRAWLLDYRAWSFLDFKTQSIYHHQLYSLACEHPKLLNDLNVVSRLLESLSLHFLSTSHRKLSKDKGGSSTQNSKYSAEIEKEQHWKLQCIQTIMETLEVCLMNQSVYVREVMEQEILETTFAKASDANPGPAPVSPSPSPTLSNSQVERETGSSVAAMQRRKGGVFFISLENIIWSDQNSANHQSASEHRGGEQKSDEGSRETSVLPNVQIRFSLLRDLRSVVRFLAACPDPTVCVSLLQLLRRLSVAYLDLRFGLISSNVVDALLLMLRSSPKGSVSRQNNSRVSDPASSSPAAEVRMACVPLLIYLLDWLESVEGRTVWCGLEEHLRSVLNGEGNYTRGFLELMMEFYFDPVGLSGVQQSIVMNDPSKKESVLFPMSPIHGSKPHGSSVHDSGIVVMSDDGFRSESDASAVNTGGSGNGLAAWIKVATGFCGKKLSLSWEKRVQIVRMAALRSLTPSVAGQEPLLDGEKSSSSCRETRGDGEEASVMNVYDKAVAGILVLPLRSILPFLPALLVNTSVHVRDRVLMEISVKLKTDDAQQDHQILMMKRDWIEALLELFVVCSDGHGEQTTAESEDLESIEEHAGRRTALRTGAFSFDANKTGEDLVVDAIVCLLCGAMQHPRGWRAFIDLIAALKVMQRKYSPPSLHDGFAQADASSSSIPAVLGSVKNIHLRVLLVAHPIDWLCQITGIVLQKMARSRIILSKILTENVHKVLVLVQEALLANAHQHCPPKPLSSIPNVPQRASGRYVWSDAQLFVLNAVLDMCARLVDSTHKVYRSGLVPGLQILQSSLSYVPPDGAALVERITQIMEKAFQQELNTASGVRVYDHMTPREVFLSALVCLRRALLVQQGSSTGSGERDSDVCAALQLLILKLCTSEVFLEDLHNNELSVHVLSDMSEQSAVVAVLNALGAVMNETEMHEREEEADLVPLFPSARELRRLDLAEDDESARESGADLDPDPFAIAFAGNMQTAKNTQSFDDDIERSLWAALEVEENRMLETLKESVSREKKRYERIVQVVIPKKDAWTCRLWDFQEYKFRSQHAHSFLNPKTASAILQEYGRRVGVYEAPLPARLRRPYELDLPVTAEQNKPAPETEERKRSDADSRRRRFSLPLEVRRADARPKAGSTDGETQEIDMSDEGQMLLERVGRVIAAQRGGEIQDITSESAGISDAAGQHTSFVDDAAVNPTSDELEGMEKGDRERYTAEDDLEQQQTKGQGSASTNDDLSNNLRPSSLPSALWYGTSDSHKESGLDPSEGVGLTPGEHTIAQAKCRRVVPEGMVNGNLYFCAKVLVFVPTNTPDTEAEPARDSDEAAPGQRRCWRWKYKHLSAVFLRRFRLRDSAIEIFLQNGSCHFLDFPHVVKQQRNELVRLLYSFLPRSVPKQWPGRMAGSNLSALTKAWQNRQISNFEYLMGLNTYAGRSFNDLTQYPVFPWVIKNFESDVLDLSDPHNFRDLSKPVGALNPERLQEFWDRYNSFDDPVIPKFLYGSHYSTCAGVVLFFLVRMQPFADLHRKMQGGTFDLPDRLFYSIRETWNLCNSQMSEVKELTPEFYCDPEFLKNNNSYEFGKRHDHVQVKDVLLPPWAKRSPEEFVRLHRAALESEYVSQHLHEWVDLIFGFKQRGKAALKANNVFYYLTYYGVVDLDRIEDPFIRESMELQIAHFGQCPMQLFNSPHPKRNPNRRVISLGPANPQIPVPGAPSSTIPIPSSALVSPGLRSPVAASPALSAGTSVVKPLSSMFQDLSPSAQEQRRHWSPPFMVKPLASSAVRWIKIFPDRFLTVNELGVVELYNWKLTPKTPSAPMVSLDSNNVQTQGNADAHVDDFSEPGTPVPLPEISTEDHISTLSLPINVRGGSEDEIKPAQASMEEGSVGEQLDTLSSPRFVCPWLLEVVRDDSPFDVVPRIPVFEDTSSSPMPFNPGFPPLVASLNGRVLISGGAPNGSIQLRMLDLDNGHVVAKASVTGHDASVTCLSVDRFSYPNLQLGSQQSDGDEVLVSGSKDMTLGVWRLSRTKPDLLFRPPRISSSPIMILRGHKFPLIDCCVSTYLNVVASCSTKEALVHFLHDDGAVAFTFRADEVQAGASFVGIVASSRGFIVSLVRWIDTKSLTTSSACVVYNLAGVAVLTKVFEGEDVSQLQLSREGDLVILTMRDRGVIRMCRLEDFAVVQEYESPIQSDAPVCVVAFGPDEATVLAISGHSDGSMVLHLLPDADGSVSLLANLRRFLGVNSKLKMVKGTVQQAQNLAWTTLGNAKAVTTTARDIAGEAIGEAKSIVKGFISYLRQGSGPGPGT